MTKKIVKFLAIFIGIPAVVLFLAQMIVGLMMLDNIYVRMLWGVLIVTWGFIALKISSADINNK